MLVWVSTFVLILSFLLSEHHENIFHHGFLISDFLISGSSISGSSIIISNSILNFSKVEFSNTQSTNFGKNNGSSISVGSLNTSGGSISNVGYKIIFKPKTTITNILGLISVQNIETLGINLNKLSVKIK